MTGWTRIIAIILGLQVWGISLFAQYKITGVVRDAHSEEIIPFATLQFPHTNTGMVTDVNGAYTFDLSSIPGDSLQVRVMGYRLLAMPVKRNVPNQTINFDIERSDVSLKVHEVRANVNFALILLRQIVRHKPENNFDRIPNYKYQLYNKIEIDLKNVNKKKFSHNFLTRPFTFILDNIDSTSEEQPFLPVYLTETMSEYYYQKDPHKTKEIINASKTSGIDNASLMRLMGGMYQNVNVYDNFIPVFDKQFASPINNNGQLFYDYKIADTEYISNQRFIKLAFTPKRKGDNAFSGDIWVHDTTYAVMKVTLTTDRSANINFIKKISMVQEFRQMPDSTWFLAKDKFVADFSPPGPNPTKTLDFIGRKTTTYTDVVMNDTAVTNIFSDKRYPSNINLLADAQQRQDTFWSHNRPDSLNGNEAGIYKMVDSLYHMPLFNKYYNTIKFIAGGYKPFGPIKYGPWYYIFTANDLEGFRTELDLATTKQFNPNLYLTGYLAYGFSDHVYKGQFTALYLLSRHPRSYVYGSYTKDLDNGITYTDEIGTGNIFSVAIRKPGVPQKFLMTETYRAEYFKEYWSGFSYHLNFIRSAYHPFAPLPTIEDYAKEGQKGTPLTNFETKLQLRYAWHENFLEGDFYRTSLGSKYPIVEADYSVGIPDVLGSQYAYQRVALQVYDYVKVPPVGKFYYNVFAGKIFGTLPYTQLDIAKGNELYYYDKYAFNMMNRFEFLSDEYVGVNLEHTIGNGLLGYIPLIKKLKWRQFWTAKGLIGDLSPANRELNLTKGYPFRTLKGNPYLEVGTGIENIFKFLRVDFIWRVTPQPTADDQWNKRFGVFGSFKLSF